MRFAPLALFFLLSQNLFAQSNTGWKPQVVTPGQSPPKATPAAMPGLGTEQSPPPSKAGEHVPNMTDGTEYFNGEFGIRPDGTREDYGPGKMEPCDQASDSAKQRLEEAKQYRANCPAAQKGPKQRIAINDYSVRPSWMYIFDENDKCLGKTLVAFGNGAGGNQYGCNDANSHMSPFGFHLTAEHHGREKFNPSNSMKMVGLQGQGSVGRGILIHGSAAPGGASTWGCAGVPYSAFKAVQRELGYGALVYNYFSPSQVGNCGNRNGLNSMAGCQLDQGSPNIPMANGGSGAVAWWYSLLYETADAALPPLPPREYISKGVEITIWNYMVKSDTYTIKMIRAEAQGPNVVTPEALRAALGVSEPLKEFKKRVARDTGTNYVLKNRVPLLWGREIYQRQQKLKKGR